ncbi:hypothetical protein DAKH74_046230 [Maudiozyma humilis]|uniref:PH domain-containing protein n=1 Tax=Maudiozyma humilis TaxID=51915 RepID=A0AAV5S310_MAUHU|nr:hypothetical protein DAKH74_046230 [Kazachstania humilis]
MPVDANRPSTAPTSHQAGVTHPNPTTQDVSALRTDGPAASTVHSRPLLKLKLLDALRKGSYTDLRAFLTAQFVPLDDPAVVQVSRLLLHYAIQVAPFPLIKEIVARDVGGNGGTRPNDSLPLLLDLNAQDSRGNTPLHLAALQSRTDVVSLLMDQPAINDCVANDANLQPYELCRSQAVAQLMQFKRAQYVAAAATELRTAFNNRDFQHLEAVLDSPRSAQLLDINGTDPQTGDTVLHEFVKKRDVAMCRWLLGHGADPFRRDSKGRLPVDLVKDAVAPAGDAANATGTSASAATSTPDVEIKQMLEKSATEQSVIDIDGAQHKPEKLVGNRLTVAPTLRGYLQKWTNFAQGYKLRYFILSGDGILSYYIDQDDTQNACRGSLYVANCYIHLDSSEKLKFEIIGGGANETVRWHLKGNHPVETNRWVWAVQGAIRYAKDRSRGIRNARDSGSTSGILSQPLGEPASPVISATAQLATAAPQVVETATQVPSVAPAAAAGPAAASPQGTPMSLSRSRFEEEVELDEDEEEEDEDENNRMYDIATNNGADAKLTYGPYSQRLHILRRSIGIELASLGELLDDPALAEAGGARDVLATIAQSVATMSSSFDKLNESTEKRDRRLINMLKKQYDVNNVWMQSMKELELELIEKDTRLTALETERKQLRKLLDAVKTGGADVATATAAAATSEPLSIASPEGDSHGQEAIQQLVELIHQNDEDQASEDSDVDEFFDAEEAVGADEDAASLATAASGSAALPTDADAASTAPEQTPVDYNRALTPTTSSQEHKLNFLEQDESFKGYEHGPRTRLKLDADNRPTVSLWGVLKSMVGKDLTKIALPVSFNEPSSMLQRVSEEYEYGYLLTHASTLQDSALRMLYVAVFTAAPYASTINRVAKPFNPLLGETFEFTDKQREFRFVTEQVSHHPPVCATMGETPRWDFYGESNVDSKFNGRSFNIKHLGKWFVHIRPDGDAAREEVYSFRKPENSVIGILVGKPEVDNVGECRIDNHTTGDYCLLHYRARGWTMAGAYEVRGEVYDRDGTKRWVLGGHWNDAIYAKRCVDETVPEQEQTAQLLETDKSEAAPAPGLNEPRFDGSKFLVWRANPRQTGVVPFNLTPYAVQLNDDDPQLLEWVAPTDSRRRPDQRAMEEGRYDDAAEEKYRLEEKQRQVRKQREQAGEEWAPRWFARDVHPATGDSYWRFTREYWRDRARHDWARCDDIF